MLLLHSERRIFNHNIDFLVEFLYVAMESLEVKLRVVYLLHLVYVRCAYFDGFLVDINEMNFLSVQYQASNPEDSISAAEVSYNFPFDLTLHLQVPEDFSGDLAVSLVLLQPCLRFVKSLKLRKEHRKLFLVHFLPFIRSPIVSASLLKLTLFAGSSVYSTISFILSAISNFFASLIGGSNNPASILWMTDSFSAILSANWCCSSPSLSLASFTILAKSLSIISKLFSISGSFFLAGFFSVICFSPRTFPNLEQFSQTFIWLPSMAVTTSFVFLPHMSHGILFQHLHYLFLANQPFLLYLVVYYQRGGHAYVVIGLDSVQRRVFLVLCIQGEHRDILVRFNQYIKHVSLPCRNIVFRIKEEQYQVVVKVAFLLQFLE